MGISIYAVLIIITSLFAKVEDFEGYIHKSERYGSTPNYIYAIGQYEEDLMNGVWEFYTDSTKKVKIAKGEGKINTAVRKVLEHMGRHVTADMFKIMKGKKRDTLGRIYRAIFEPTCRIIGKIKSALGRG